MITRRASIDKARKVLLQKQQSEIRVPVVIIQKGEPIPEPAKHTYTVVLSGTAKPVPV
jgi:hypothetical protein